MTQSIVQDGKTIRYFQFILVNFNQFTEDLILFSHLKCLAYKY